MLDASEGANRAAKLLSPGDGKPLSFVGVSTVLKVVGEDTGGAWSLIESTVEPHFAGFKLHRPIYRLRKCTVEPVMGLIKEILGFRQFSLRGLAAAAGEWCWVCLAFNLKRLQYLDGGLRGQFNAPMIRKSSRQVQEMCSLNYPDVA